MDSVDAEVITKYCESKQVPEETRSYLNSLPECDLRAIISLIKDLSPSSNTLRTFVDLLGDIQHRDKLNFSDILDKASLCFILSSSGSSKDKQIKLKNSLMRIRFPEKFTIEDSLNNLTSKIREEFGVKIILPEELEGDQLQVNLCFRSGEGLSIISKKLANLADSKQLEEIFSILKGEL